MTAIRRWARLACLLAMIVVPLGAYVRLSDAGLGCPDWPGCYGHLAVPDQPHEQAAAARAFPGLPLDAGKAAKEMLHRYLAGGLGFMIAGVAWLDWRRARRRGEAGWRASQTLVLVVTGQALLGMWTVTLLLKPAIVTLHLLGGMLVLSLLAWLGWRDSRPVGPVSKQERRLAWLAVAVVGGQVVLGGWVSSNYAGLACGTGVPQCRGQWWPDDMRFADSFHLWRELGQTADGAMLDLAHLTAIHWLHRLGALAVVLLGSVWVRHLWQRKERRPFALWLAVLLLGQVALGVLNVVWQLPLPLAVAHNLVGALLFACVFWQALQWQTAGRQVLRARRLAVIPDFAR